MHVFKVNNKDTRIMSINVSLNFFCNLEYVHSIHAIFFQLTLSKYLCDGLFITMKTRFNKKKFHKKQKQRPSNIILFCFKVFQLTLNKLLPEEMNSILKLQTRTLILELFRLQENQESI